MRTRYLPKLVGGALGVLLILVIMAARRANAISDWWYGTRGEHGLSRNEADKQREEHELADVGMKDLACTEITTHYEFTSVWVEGCGKHVDYLRIGGEWQKKGDPIPIDRATGAHGCTVKWSADDDGANDNGTIGTPLAARDAASGNAARDAAREIFERKATARIRVPTRATGVKGLDIIVVGPTLDQWIDPDAGPDAFAGDKLTVACAVDAGGALCAVPWSVVVEVAECH